MLVLNLHIKQPRGQIRQEDLAPFFCSYLIQSPKLVVVLQKVENQVGLSNARDDIRLVLVS